MSILTKEFFHNENAAIKYLEDIIWYEGVRCPHCVESKKVYSLTGKSTRPGLKKCGVCRKQFTVKVGTIFESSHIPLHKWLQATYLISSSKKGISSHQLHRTLEVTYKTAWFMMHRIREAMKSNDIEPLGGVGKMVEIDEMYTGGHKDPLVLGMVERKGRIVSRVIPNKKWASIIPLVRKNVKRGSIINTDESNVYTDLGRVWYKHESLNHTRKEYTRGKYSTNSIEGYFGIFKRGMKGIYQHCAPQHLQRYLCEFDFRYNHRGVSDIERFRVLLTGVCGKRLKYGG